MTRTLAHIINPVVVGESSDLFIAQPITFRTMQTARDFARDTVQVSLFSANYPEDASLVPEGFEPTPYLERSILDFGKFSKQRKLPLLKDILDRLYAATDAEYLIYTNVDIALMPYFYLAVNEYIAMGCDAFVINRRSISACYQTVAQIPRMYAEAGQPHPGYDCFVFKRDVYPHYQLAHVCIGATRVGLALLANLVAFAKHFHEFTDVHLTFHLGDDQGWTRQEYNDYTAFNEREVYKVLAALQQGSGPFTEESRLGAFLLEMRKKRNLAFAAPLFAEEVIQTSRLDKLKQHFLGRSSRGR